MHHVDACTLPISPYILRQHSPHNLPMRKSTPVQIRVKTSSIMRVENTFPTLGNGLELGRINLIFMPRQKIRLARQTSQEVRRCGISETKRRGGALLAKGDHVYEVWVFGRRSALVEDAACREGSVDCADDETRWIEGDVTGIVLNSPVVRQD